MFGSSIVSSLTRLLLTNPEGWFGGEVFHQSALIYRPNKIIYILCNYKGEAFGCSLQSQPFGWLEALQMNRAIKRRNEKLTDILVERELSRISSYLDHPGLALSSKNDYIDIDST